LKTERVKKIVERKKTFTDPSFNILYDRLNRKEHVSRVAGLQGSAKSFLVSLIHRHIQKTLIVITPTEKEAKDIYQDITCFTEEHDRIALYSPRDAFSVDMFAFQREVEMSRIQVLCLLRHNTPAIIVTPLKALMQKVIPKSALEDYTQQISIGDTVDRDLLITKLIEGGYSRTALVEDKGQFSVRGHVIDIHPPTMSQPVRMEFLGDEVESLRKFNPASQRSAGELIDFTLTPVREIIFSEERKRRAVRNIKQRANELGLSRGTRTRLIEMILNGLLTTINPLFLPLFYISPDGEDNEHTGNSISGERENPPDSLGTFFDYLPENSVLVWDDLPTIEKTAETIENGIDRLLLKARNEEKFYLEKDYSTISRDILLRKCERFQTVFIENLPIAEGSNTTDSALVKFHVETDVKPGGQIRESSAGEGLLKSLVEKIKQRLREGNLVTLFGSGQEEVQRIRHLLEHYTLSIHQPASSFAEDVDRHEVQGRLVVREGKITTSFHIPDRKLVVITDEEIFGRKIPKRRLRPAREGYFLRSFGELKEGDYAVHTDHGIGIYRGLQKLSIGEIENDFLLLEYMDGDKLYIPVDRIDQIQKYIGPEGFVPRVDKLGGSSWEATKEKVKKSIREVAEELISIYAAREVMEGYAYSVPDMTYDEFCSTFEFEETPDQSGSIEDVLADMSTVKPMDRLVCGDAGFGKTEVALRASFRAAMEGKQVAILVPTTILAEQHFQTFSRRLREYPLRVEVLNRLKTKADQQKIVEGILKGTVDIIIGTHRILQSDIKFKDLGLVIIDEEQRFGVAHKEKLKKLRTLVDVLTLTATPIPRTLHLSLIGIRDLSVINTPPEDRLPVKTYVVEFNEEVIQDAIRQELNRNGQVFFLHDRVRSIHTIARLVERLVPEARIGVVHGRMKGKDIEDTMTKFIRNEYNVLVCTSIIASGLDIPTANTMLINRADRFGLSQLYQIRGRVGRSKEESFAYLFIPKGSLLSRDAQRRLRVITEFSEPGSGFKIAANDLDIRGAGNILGTSQSGHISAVGYELYTELMEKTVREIKGEKMPEAEVKPEIHLGVPAFIPEGYMPDVQSRLVTYKRLSTASTDQDLSEIREELTDCYGFVPEEVENLFELIRIRNLMKTIRGKKIGYDGETMSIHLDRCSPIDPSKIIELTRQKGKGVRFTPDFMLTIPVPYLHATEITGQAREFLEHLVN
jgi:transcription-repair coupling factor (superfamily II helicase)